MRIALRSNVASLAAVAVLAFAPAAFAEMQHYTAELKASSEVPPNTSKATGSLDATYDTASKKLTYTATYSGLTGPATAAHFHGPAPTGKNAGVAVPISPNASPFQGSATLTDAQAADLMAGQWYVNIHTAANKAGEIRGQLTK